MGTLDGWANVYLDGALPDGRATFHITDCPGQIVAEAFRVQAVTVRRDGRTGRVGVVRGPERDADAQSRIAASWYASPDWERAIEQPGYVGSCPREHVSELLSSHGFSDAELS